MRYLLLMLLPVLTYGQDSLCVSFGEPSDIEPRIMGWNRDVSWKHIYAVVHVHYVDSAISEDVVNDAMLHLNEEFLSSSISFDHAATEYHQIDSVTLDYCFPWDYAEMEAYIGPLQWDPTEYMNIHVYPNLCGSILGFAFLYNESWLEADGAYIQTDVFGRFGSHLGYEDRSENKTLIHEAGHYCGLYHVFQGIDFCGEEEYDCSQVNDRVCDTPPTKLNWSCENPVCPPGLYNYEPNNHMDYYVDSCRTQFTDGQITRMHSMLDAWRPGLASADPYCAGDVDNDLVVGVDDLMLILTQWGEYHQGPPDLNHDGIVDLDDFHMVLTNWGSVCYGALPQSIYNLRLPKQERGRSPFPFK